MIDPGLHESFASVLESECADAPVMDVVTNPRYWEELGKVIGERIDGNTICFDQYARIRGVTFQGKQVYRTWTWGSGGVE